MLIGNLPAGGQATISFEGVIALNTNGVVNNQAQVTYTGPAQPNRGATSTHSDDPATPDKPGDPTTTVIDGPTALAEETEPGSQPVRQQLFLPAIGRD